MLNKYLVIQKDKLDLMLAKQAQLQLKSLEEQQRLAQLQLHIDSMDKSMQMKSAISLQNLSGMKGILSGLSNQQSTRLKDSQQDELRQQQACLKQMTFTKGIEGIVKNRVSLKQDNVNKQEEKALDEMVSQAYVRQLYK
ncbi:hypothetical protein V6260_10165 [Pseudoalteromonas aliena]|uniref:hypothetical protein n=1 Tax=Pseudoalteromonas aliena TaxID=247523 RepID=UPI00311E92C2